MGCKSACVCGGFCPGCTSYEPESYFGEAESIYDKVYGNSQQVSQKAAYNDEQARQYHAEMEAEHYKNHPDNPANQNITGGSSENRNTEKDC